MVTGWVDVTWDSGGSNSYRMGAEGKFDLALAPSHDPEKLRPAVATRGSALSKKSSSTPSLTESSDNQSSSIASTDQAASADNITKQIKSVSHSLLLHLHWLCAFLP